MVLLDVGTVGEIDLRRDTCGENGGNFWGLEGFRFACIDAGVSEKVGRFRINLPSLQLGHLAVDFSAVLASDLCLDIGDVFLSGFRGFENLLFPILQNVRLRVSLFDLAFAHGDLIFSNLFEEREEYAIALDGFGFPARYQVGTLLRRKGFKLLTVVFLDVLWKAGKNIRRTSCAVFGRDVGLFFRHRIMLII